MSQKITVGQIDSLTATATELNILDGVTATTAELNYTDGVTSNIQTQLDAKLALAGGTMSGAIAMGTNKITGMGDPTAAQDAATKAYVDSQGGGGIADVVEDTTPQLGGDLQSNGNDVVFADNDKAIFGAGSDLQIFHDGSNSYVQDTGTGDIIIKGDNVRLQDSAGGNLLVADTNDAVQLYYGYNQKLATTATGVDVTGTLVSDGLTVAGDAVFEPDNDGVRITGTNYATLRLEENDTTDLNTSMFNSGGKFSIYTSSDDRASGTERVTLDHSNGSVGIGTSSPIAQSKLTVAGNSLSITGSDANFSAGGVRGMLDLAGGYLRMGAVNGGGSANGIKLITPTGGEAVVVDSSGHVGIGTLIGTRANSLSIESTGSNSPWAAKSSTYATVASILPWGSCHSYIGTGVYYDDGAWVHASDTTTNSLFALHGAGANWYSSNNSTGSWNVASSVPLWNASGQWTGDINTTYDINTGVITGTATSARYADLAERYTTDADYEAGTVVVFGGEAEVTQSTQRLDRRVAGIVSTDPAYLMNSELENSVAVGLQGRVPCKVVGEIRKGDMMVTSSTPGHAEAWREESNPPMGGVIGKALENKTGAGADVIEVVVGRL